MESWTLRPRPNRAFLEVPQLDGGSHRYCLLAARRYEEGRHRRISISFVRSCSVELVPGAAGILGPTKRAISTTHNSAAQSSVDSGKSVSNRSSRLPFKFRVLREESSK